MVYTATIVITEAAALTEAVASTATVVFTETSAPTEVVVLSTKAAAPREAAEAASRRKSSQFLVLYRKHAIPKIHNVNSR